MQLYRAGRPLAEIGRELGLTEKGVQYRVQQLVRAGELERRPALPRGPYQTTAEQVEELRRRYEAGETWAELADWLGVTEQTLEHRLKMAGVELDRAPPRWETAQHWPWPLTLEEVAIRMFGSGDAISRRRASHNVHNWLAQGKLVSLGWARYDLSRREQ